MADELTPLLRQSMISDSSTRDPSKPAHHPNGCHSCHPPLSHRRWWIPEPDDTEHHPNRTLILCFDGTGDSFDDAVGSFHCLLLTLSYVVLEY
jgi:hypothetical protein